MSQSRRVAFSGKKKKHQILLKRQVKNAQRFGRPCPSNNSDDEDTTEDTDSMQEINVQPFRGRNKIGNRYNLKFYQENEKEVRALKQKLFNPIKPAAAKDREIDGRFFEHYDFPIRPEWNYKMTKERLDMSEHNYFKKYVDGVRKLQADIAGLSLFELNLETWRQLWRVLEMSDILLIIVDIRYATLMFPPFLYTHITETLNKHAILVLNKVDLVSPEVVAAWRSYFKETFPEITIVLFASYPVKGSKGLKKGPRAHKRSIEGVYNIYKECHKFVDSRLDISAWEQKILEDMQENFLYDDDSLDKQSNMPVVSSNNESDDEKHTLFNTGVLTIGCIGFPNVGKSSFINAIKGKKVVSVSRTPGHTKHFQTIFLTKNVRFCDCPGLVFPSSTPKHIQVLIGSYPIAQLRHIYPVKFLAEHINLPEVLKLKLPEDCDDWSPEVICDAWARKRGYFTAKAARPDIYRAGNELLRMCLGGQIILEFYPPNFLANREQWQNDPSIDEIRKYQGDQCRTDEDLLPDNLEVFSDDNGEQGTESSSEVGDDTIEDDSSSATTSKNWKGNVFAALADE